MADLNAKLIPLYSETEGRVPTAEQLDIAELSYNITDRKIYTKDSAGNVVVMGAGADGDGAGLPGGGYEPNEDTNGDPIDLASGDVLRYDGSNWRPRQYKLEELDNVSGTPADRHVIQYDGTSWQSQIFSFNIEDADDFALRTDEGSGNPIPKATGDSLVWDGTAWVPANPAGFLSISDLSDVNTVTNAPSDGQALVWDATQNYWKPGTVASEAPSIALDDLTDVSVANPASGQFLKYASGSWSNVALAYADISDAPAVPSSIGDLSDVDLSDAPIAGQVLVWNGTTWKPDDQAGGGGDAQTITGALSERADVSVSKSYNIGATKDIEFNGLGEAGQFVQVTSSQPAWTRFYATDGDRTSDVSRDADTDPLPGSGVLLEVRTDQPSQTVKISPGALYYNNDILPTQTLYARVTNESGASAVINVTIRAYTQTSTDAIDGGTFGSG